MQDDQRWCLWLNVVFLHALCMTEWVANHYCGKGIGRKLTFIRLDSFDVGNSQIWQDFGLGSCFVWTIGSVFRRFLEISPFRGKIFDFWSESSYKLTIFLCKKKQQQLYVLVTRNLYFYLCVLLRGSECNGEGFHDTLVSLFWTNAILQCSYFLSWYFLHPRKNIWVLEEWW